MKEQTSLSTVCSIVNKHGLHTRSASAIVTLANKFKSEIIISSDKCQTDARDMIRLMLLEASKGSKVTITTSGEDAEQASKSMVELFAAGFYE
jgi:phosphotransferase system HPr (HPr) family protein